MQCFCNSCYASNLLVMVWRLSTSLKHRKLIPTPDCSGTAPTLVLFYSEYSTPPLSSTMPEKTRFSCPEFSCQKKFSSDSWGLNHIKIHYSEHLEQNLTVRSVTRRIEPAQRCEFNTNKESVKDFDEFPYLENIEYLAATESQPPPHLPQRKIYHGAGAPRDDYIAETC